LQTLAREFNLSETLFICPQQQPRSTNTDARSDSNDHEIPTWRVRIFLTTAEIPFAGHPTIGAACYALRTLLQPPATATDTAAGNVTAPLRGRFICPAGPIDLSYDPVIERATAKIPHNFHEHTEHPSTTQVIHDLQPSLVQHLQSESSKSDLVISTISPVKGMNFLSVQLSSLDHLAQIRTSATTPAPQLDESWEEGFVASYWYVLLSRPEVGEEGVVRARIQARMIEGLLEDPATGSAACALGMFLALRRARGDFGPGAGGGNGSGGRVFEFEMLQGVEMGRRSEIGVRVLLKEGGREVESVELSGCAVEVMKGVAEI